MAYDALAIANYFLNKAAEEGAALDPLKLQKLIYFAHGWHLAFFNEPLIKERVEAWDYGPVIPAIYKEFRSFGRSPITERAVSLRPVPSVEGGRFELFEVSIDANDQRTRSLLDKVWQEYKRFSGVQLANLTHLPGTPWDKLRREDRYAKVIDDDDIRDYFLKQKEQNAARRQA